MRVPFLLVFFISVLYGTAWAQPRIYPLSWDADAAASVNARTQATTAFTNTLKLPYFYDFSSRYLHIDTIIKGSTVRVVTMRPHGLKSNDTVVVSGAKAPAVVTDLNGLKVVNRISDYEVELYNDAGLTTPVSSTQDIDYLRINKLRAIETIIPDTLAFQYNQGGVQIDGGSGKNQPSYYVARFDGLRENGVPYNTTDQYAEGETDSLRSQPFDFSSYTVTDNLYMSYYYQNGGYGTQTENNDHLYLDFLDNTLQWNTVKDLTGATGHVDSFYIAMVPINDNKFLHNAFQYRFRSYGRQSGAYDIWNLDYIYINSNRTPADTTIRDFAIRNGDQSFLQFGYTAMPFNHFFTGNNDATTYFNKTLKTTVTHQANLGKLKSIDIVLRDKDEALVSTFQSAVDSDVFKDRTYTNTIGTQVFPTRNAPTYIDLSYLLTEVLRTDVDVPISTGSMEMMFNNVVTKRTFLYDYYAYDDSQAEAGAGFDEGGVQVATQFVCKHKDTLTHVDFCFTRNKSGSLENYQMFLMVWGDTVTTELYREPINIHYPSSPNGFVRYKLVNPIVIDSGSKFHIGYLKNFPELLTVGYDRNRDSRAKSFYKSGNTWYRMDTPLADVDLVGTMMMRPIFFKASNNVPVGVQHPEGVSKNMLLLYPNPASESIDIVATEEVSDLSYTMYSLYGQTVGSGIITATDHTINVSQLSTGMYLILCTDTKGKMYSTRFIKE